MDPANRERIYDTPPDLAIKAEVMIRRGAMSRDDLVAPLSAAAERAAAEQRRCALAALAGLIAKGFPENDYAVASVDEATTTAVGPGSSTTDAAGTVLGISMAFSTFSTASSTLSMIRCAASQPAGSRRSAPALADA